jgi:hypothetical protein
MSEITMPVRYSKLERLCHSRGDFATRSNLLIQISLSFGSMVMFTNGGTCLFDIVHSAVWGYKYPVCTPDTQVLFLSGALMLYTQHSAVKALPGGGSMVMFENMHAIGGQSHPVMAKSPQFVITMQSFHSLYLI